MLKSLLSCGSLVLVLGEQGHDEVLGIVRHVTPDCVLKRELSKFDLLHDLLVRCAVERWDSREYDVRDNTARPNIALWSVVLGQYFWSNIVWRTQFLVKLLVLIEDQ